MRIGWASWDDGSLTERSIKYPYPDASGKISRGCPELPFDILVDMCLRAADNDELASQWKPQRTRTPLNVEKMADGDLEEEKKMLTIALLRLIQLEMDVRWADWAKVHGPISSRLEEVKSEMSRRKTAV